MANNCKYKKLEDVISYDGTLWESQNPPVYLKGDLIEPQSQDCEDSSSTTLERWVTVDGDYLCDGNNKYKKEILKQSFDGGVTWYPSNPAAFRTGQFVSVDKEFCSYSSESHYIPVDPSVVCSSLSCNRGYVARFVDGKCRCVNADPIKTTKCITDSGTVITANSLLLGGYGYALVSTKIGECATRIDDYAFSRNTVVRAYIEEVDMTGAVNLESIGTAAFSGCNGILDDGTTKVGNGITSIEIPSGVTSIESYAFARCTNLSSFTFADDSQITSIGTNAFSECYNLTGNFTLPSSITLIDDYLFGETSLKSLTVLATQPPSFPGTLPNASSLVPCDALIYVPSGSVDTYKAAAGWSEIADKILPIGYVNGLHGVTWNTSYATCSHVFKSCEETGTMLNRSVSSSVSGSSYVEVGDCVTNIEEGAFSGMTKISGVSLSDSVISIGFRVFSGCTNLSSINMPQNLVSIANCAFCNAGNGNIDFTLPSGFYSLGASAFCGCEANSIYIPSTLRYGLNASLFLNCSIRYATVDANNTFYDSRNNCNAIISTSDNTLVVGFNRSTIPDGITSIGSRAFYGRPGIENITIPNTVTNIGASAFTECASLGSINIPEGVTTIGDSVFRHCINLASATLPSSITNIGNYAFFNCTRLGSITVTATTPPSVGGSSFGSTNNCPIYVPAASVDTYKAASGWSTYASRIQPIP